MWTKANTIKWAIANNVQFVYSQRCPLSGSRVYCATNDAKPHMTLEWSATL